MAFVTICWWEHKLFFAVHCVLPVTTPKKRNKSEQINVYDVYPLAFRHVSYGLGIAAARCSSVPQ